jgi:hypothetical protein
MEDTIIKWTTFAIAVVGCVLGVVNFITEIVRRKPRATATLRECHVFQGSLRHVCAVIRVVNTGECTIYLDQFGLSLPRKKGFLYVKPQMIDGGEVPNDLLPGQSVSVVIDNELWIGSESDFIVRAFVRISTGKEFYTKRFRKRDIARYRAFAKEHLDILNNLNHAVDSFEKGVL